MESSKTNSASMALSTTLLFLLLLHSTLGAAQQVLRKYECSESNGNYTSTSTYKSNLDTLLTSISSNTNISYGFFNFSTGKSPDQANGVALCRGDVGFSDCHTCLEFVITKVTQLCPVQREAIGWADNCMLRYSNRSIFAVWEEAPYFVLQNGTLTGNDAQFGTVQQSLMDSVKNAAASGDSSLKFATQEGKVNASISIYMLMQCTPDLTQGHCVQCLYRTIARSSVEYGERVLLPSCNLRYELYKFYNSSVSPAASPSSQKSSTGKSSSSTVVIVVAVVASLVVLVIILLFWFLRRRRKMWKRFKIKLDGDDEIGGVQSLQYDLDTIKAATGNFSEVNKVGRGGYGDVYKGTMDNGREIAVKRLTKFSGQGELEFKNEVMIVAKLQHRNLIRLLGFCLEDRERLLIYEFVLNASLDRYLFGMHNKEIINYDMNA
ncbi:hypothetical protein V2J09_019352 [Rumex salicifolius]